MRELPSSLIVLTPTRAMLEWLNDIGEEPLTMEEITQDPMAVVIPECESDDEFEDFLAANWKPLFERMLNDWSLKELWPKDRDYKVFRDFVEVKTCSMVYATKGTVISESDFGQN